MIEMRATAVDERRVAADIVRAALLHPPIEDDEWGKFPDSWDESDSLLAWDGDRAVGHVAGFRFDTLVPGGAWLPTSGVTRVGVLPTHRRQRLASRLMTRLLTEARERGQILASLRASDTRIYGRFGFGLAGQCGEINVDPQRALPISGATTAGRFRLLRPDEVLATVAPIYERCADLPGVLRRPDWMWRRFLEKATQLGGDAEYVVVHTSDDGVDDGFAHYGVSWNHPNFENPTGKGELIELWGADAGIELALWTYLCNIDLVVSWYGEERPLDEPLQFAVNDTRSYQLRRTWDEQWMRLLDVDAALTARTYNQVEGSFTLDVNDALLPTNDGRWELSASGAKRVDPSSGQADLVADVRNTAATYLGGVRWSRLAAAGRITVNNPAALAIADALFIGGRLPFCNSGF